MLRLRPFRLSNAFSSASPATTRYDRNPLLRFINSRQFSAALCMTSSDNSIPGAGTTSYQRSPSEDYYRPKHTYTLPQEMTGGGMSYGGGSSSSSYYTANKNRILQGSSDRGGSGGRFSTQSNGSSYGSGRGGYEQSRSYSSNSRGYHTGGNYEGGSGSRYNTGYRPGPSPIENIEVKKDFYVVHPEIANVSQELVEKFRKENGNIMVSSSDSSVKIPNPIVTFEQAFACDEMILQAISSQSFKQPTHIQCQIWPVLLSGYDAISISQTGSGKTLGFLLPGFVHSQHQVAPELAQDSHNPNILVICPTRELAQQTAVEVNKYAYRGFRSACVYGGSPKGPQIQQIRSGVKIIVGTPGRINDFIQSGILNLSKVTYLVLDEADVMLDMGFEPQIRSILDVVPKNRQTVMTSATWPVEARNLAAKYLVNPIQVNVGEMDLVAAQTIKQIIQFDFEDEYSRQKHLIDFLHTLNHRQEKILIFVNTKDGAKRLCNDIRQSRIRCETIHGNLDQSQRERALSSLRDNQCSVMTATDVAARGLDISGITYVVNFTMPGNIEDYVHRIGRTGRAG